MADWLYFDKDTDEDSDLISRRAEIFRSKLITSFKLLDKFTEYGHHRRKGVLFSPDDIDSTYKNRNDGYYAPPPPPKDQKFLDFTQFLGNFDKNYMLAPPAEGWRPSSGNPGSAAVFIVFFQ